MYIKMSVELPMMIPRITGYAFYANLLSILGNYEQSYGWMYSNFIQLKYHRDENEGHRIYFFDKTIGMTPFVYYQRYSRDMIEEDITKLIKRALDHKHYVFLSVDYYYIPNTNCYQKAHFGHDLFIYGYDEVKKVFYIAGNMMHWKYMYSTCTFEELADAYQNYESTGSVDILQGVIMYKVMEENTYALNLPLISDSIQDYLDSSVKHMSDRNDTEEKDMIYGISTLLHTLDYLKTFIDNEEESIDIRPFHTLWDHKNMMLARVNYLKESAWLDNADKLIERFGKLNETALYNRNLALKYSMVRNKEIVKRMMDNLNIDMEIDAMRLLQKSIRY